MDAEKAVAVKLLLTEQEAEAVVWLCRHVLQVDVVAGENEATARDLIDVLESQLEQ